MNITITINDGGSRITITEDDARLFIGRDPKGWPLLRALTQVIQYYHGDIEQAIRDLTEHARILANILPAAARTPDLRSRPETAHAEATRQMPPCDRAPDGWFCMLARGHEGSCPAWPRVAMDTRRLEHPEGC